MTSRNFLASNVQPGSRLALAAFIFAFFVIMLGAYTRLTDAGLSCPDWPHCYGFITAPHTEQQIATAAALYPNTPVEMNKAWTEMTHRYCAGIEALLIAALSYTLFLSRRLQGSVTLIKAGLLLGLLGVQILLGALTVTQKLTPVIVLSHLLTGVSILSVLWWTFLDARFVLQPDQDRVAPLWLWLGLIIVAAQITLGGWVSTHYAGLACVDFPYCNGKLLPAMQWSQWNSNLITIHMLHRIGALMTAGFVTLLVIRLLWSRSCRYVGLLILTVLFAQLSLGILNIVWLRPVWVALLHQAVGIALLLSMILGLVFTTKIRDQ